MKNLLPRVIPSVASPSRPHNFIRVKPRRLGPVFITLLLSGCAFDVISVPQTAVEFQMSNGGQQTWTLNDVTRIHLKQGFATDLKQGTNWVQTGCIAQGDVFGTKDQVVTVEASNQYEAELVVSNNLAVGFYLPVERTFTPADRPIPIKSNPAVLPKGAGHCS